MNRGRGLLGDTARIEEAFRIGVIDGDEPYLFSRIEHVAVDAEGWVFVANGRTSSVRMFDPEGRFVRELGRRGSGPGEFRAIERVVPMGDEVAVIAVSPGNESLAVFDRDGPLLSYMRLRHGGGAFKVPWFRAGDGWLGIVSDPNAMPYDLPAGDVHELDLSLYRLFPEADSIGERVLDIPGPRLHGTGDRAYPLLQPLFVSFEMPDADSAGRIYLANGETYRIDVYSPEGRLLRTVLRAVDPIPFVPEDVERFAALVAQRMDTLQLPPMVSRREQKERALERVRWRDRFPRPANRPPLGRIVVARDGGFWVHRSDALDPAQAEASKQGLPTLQYSGAMTWDVFNADGRYLFAAPLPPGFHPYAVTDSSVTGVQVDEFDVEYVVRYRVLPRGGE